VRGQCACAVCVCRECALTDVPSRHLDGEPGVGVLLAAQRRVLLRLAAQRPVAARLAHRHDYAARQHNAPIYITHFLLKYLLHAVQCVHIGYLFFRINFFVVIWYGINIFGRNNLWHRFLCHGDIIIFSHNIFVHNNKNTSHHFLRQNYICAFFFRIF
jgi:hypothetical protein